MPKASGLRALVVLALALPWAACDFQPDPPPGPNPVSPARFVSVLIQYRQPTVCANVGAACDASVAFFGSWMHPGQEVYLTPDPGSHVWTGVANGVPVNWPPVDEPHLVRVFDPYLVLTPTTGVTAARLTLGGQILDTYEEPGTPEERARVYIDDNGVARNPF